MNRRPDLIHEYRGLRLHFGHGVMEAHFTDAMFTSCTLSECPGHRRLLFLGVEGHAMSLYRSQAYSLGHTLLHYASTGKLPVPCHPREPDYSI